jgi:hypothetical protein
MIALSPTLATSSTVAYPNGRPKPAIFNAAALNAGTQPVAQIGPVAKGTKAGSKTFNSRGAVVSTGQSANELPLIFALVILFVILERRAHA